MGSGADASAKRRYRVRFALDEWELVRLDEGRKVPVRLPGVRDAWLVVTDVSEDPPVVWMTVFPPARARTPPFND